MLNTKRSDRLQDGWAIEYAINYFDLPEIWGKHIAGSEGRNLLTRMWESDGFAMYDSPLYALRQEWFHQAFPFRRVPTFFNLLNKNDVVLDWGCGTAESYRRDWIDKGGNTVLCDMPGPNFEYTKEKYKNQDVLFMDSDTTIPFEYDALICIDVFEHIYNPLETLERLWEGLKPGGYALLWFDHSYPHPGHLQESIKFIPEYDQWLRFNTEIIHTAHYDWVRKPKSKLWGVYELLFNKKRKPKADFNRK